MKSFVLVMATLFSACASYQVPPSSAGHPANPAAASVAVQPNSKTLSYTRADMPSPQPVMAAVAAQQGGHDSHHAEAPKKTVTGEGKVIATVPSANQIVVEHGKIKGFMDAMTMGYRVEPSSLLEGLQPGDKVRFTIDVPNKMIVKIEKMK
jgi:Cu/Ag efflux protein CusF